jgi:ribosomal protein S18 acetylase RimI-like enzyme
MLKHALQTAEQIHPRKCHLAVDVNNVPAIALYERFGFRSILKRQALIYALHD